ncbi:MAG: GNAT family N-acetyltransferase [Candidatus Edwardsbacteria bacterium]|nr:GNAT family N-acetyltransferase [Candidatus Edwardsbacteria bacterium]
MIFDKITNQDLDSLGPLQPEGWGDIVPSFKFYLESPFCFPVKTSVNEKIAGIGAAIILEGTAWLAHIIVSSENRKQGIGSEITSHLLDLTREQGCKTASLIATELGRPVYQKIGFADQEEYVFYERETPLADRKIPENISGFQEEHRARILELDRILSGEGRSRLLEKHLQNSYLHLSSGGMDGYYLPGLGEGLIMAENHRAGIELVKLKLSRSIKNVLPAGNRPGMVFMQENGFRETKRATRMVRGQRFPWQPDKMFGRIAGNLG